MVRDEIEKKSVKKRFKTTKDNQKNKNYNWKKNK